MRLLTFDLYIQLLNQSSTETDKSLVLLLLLIFLDAVIYGSLAIYLDQVVPIGFGAHRKPWYIFQREYWQSLVSFSINVILLFNGLKVTNVFLRSLQSILLFPYLDMANTMNTCDQASPRAFVFESSGKCFIS